MPCLFRCALPPCGLVLGLVAALVLAPPAHAACPSLPDLRSEFVRTRLNASLLNGDWFEVAFADPAQVGASCQHLTNHFNQTGGQQRFMVKYGPIGFNQTYDFVAVDGELGVFTKALRLTDKPKLPTVVVDVVAGDDGYDLAIEYTCVSAVGLEAQELRFVSRTPTISDTALADLKTRAASAGLAQTEIDKLKPVDFSGCGLAANHPAAFAL